jgi:hypothetical protein
MMGVAATAPRFLDVDLYDIERINCCCNEIENLPVLSFINCFGMAKERIRVCTGCYSTKLLLLIVATRKKTNPSVL